MKAVLALVVIYVATFLVAIQGASQNSVEASRQDATPQNGSASAAPAVNPAKDADIRSLLELLGARDAVQDAAHKGIEQYRENLLAAVPTTERGQQFVDAFIANYQEEFNSEDVTGALVTIYDKHFSAAEIKGLLQFYGSPLGQKYAAEVPGVNRESMAAGRAINARITKDVLQGLRKQYPGIAAQARFAKQHPGQANPAMQQAQTQP